MNIYESIDPEAGGYQFVTLQNGRKYRIMNTFVPYEISEYPIGGWVIWSQNPNKDSGTPWLYIDNSPDLETVKNFLKLAERNKNDE